MRHRLRSVLAGLAVAVVAATGLTLAGASPASAAFGDETFGCRVAPGTDLAWRGVCYNNRPATTYNAGFALLNTSGTYTFSWSISGTGTSVITGCNAVSSDCAISVAGGSSDGWVTVSVTYHQNGQSATARATAIIRGYCGGQLC
jgi:hypothetical protein